MDISTPATSTSHWNLCILMLNMFTQAVSLLVTKKRINLARSLWKKLCSVLQVWDIDVDLGLTHKTTGNFIQNVLGECGALWLRHFHKQRHPTIGGVQYKHVASDNNGTKMEEDKDHNKKKPR
jgi:hypothetical protein